MPVASCNQRNQAQKDSINRPDRHPEATAEDGLRNRPALARCSSLRYLYLSRDSCANLVGLMPHFVSSPWMKPVLCHSVTVFDNISARPFSPCLTARPHGTKRIESSGIS